MLKTQAQLPELDSSSELEMRNPNTAEPRMGKEPIGYLIHRPSFPLPHVISVPVLWLSILACFA